MGELHTTIEIAGQDATSIDFKIVEGIFAGVEYKVKSAGTGDDENPQIKIDYHVTNSKVLDKIVIDLLGRIVKADLEARLQEGTNKETDKDKE